MSEFVRDTALVPRGPGRFVATLHPGWWIARGANGGYLAAILARAMAAGAEGLPPRTLTIHYAGAPEAGPVGVDTVALRRGRTLCTLRAEITQGERLVAAAIGAFAAPRPGPNFRHREPPAAPPPEACPVFEGFHAFHRCWEYRWAFGAPPGAAGERALVGGVAECRQLATFL